MQTFLCRCQYRHIIAYFCFILCALPQIVRASDHSLYYANHTTVYQIDTTTNAVVNTLNGDGETTALAIGPQDQNLYILSHKNIAKFDTQNNQVLDIALQKVSSAISNPKQLIINPYDATIWIEGAKTILHLDSNGGLIAEFPIKLGIDSMALSADSHLWVLAQNTLFRLTPSGTQYAQFDISSYVNNAKNLAVDTLNDIVWVANDTQLFQYNQRDFGAPLPAITIDDPSGIKAIALDYLRGKLWVATNDTLRAYDKNRKLILTIPLAADAKPVDVLLADSVTGTVWVGSKNMLYEYDPVGGLMDQIAINGELEALTNNSQFTLPKPGIQILSPQNNATLANNTPPLNLKLTALCGTLSCDGGEEYYKNFTINAVLDNTNIGALFTIDGDQATYQPRTPYPDGNHTLSVSATDIYGHISNLDVSNFIIDTTPPYFVELAPVDGSLINADTVTFTGKTDDPTSTVTVKNLIGQGGTVLNPNPEGFSFQMPLSYGVTEFTLTATDPVGNITEQSVSIIRPQPFTLSVSGLNDGMLTSNTSITFTGAVTGPPGTTVTVNGQTVVLDQNGNFTLDDLQLVAGENTITVIAKTPDGQEIRKTYTIYSGGGWDAAQIISTPGNPAYLPVMGRDYKGNVMAAWLEYADGTYYVMARRYVINQGWQPIQRLARVPFWDTLTLSVGENGDAMLVWSACDYYCNANGHVIHVYALHFDSNTGWETSPTQIDPKLFGTTLYGLPQVSLDRNGNGLATFKIYKQLYYAKYRKSQGWSAPQLQSYNDYSGWKNILLGYHDGAGAVLGAMSTRRNSVDLQRYSSAGNPGGYPEGWRRIAFIFSAWKDFDIALDGQNTLYSAYPETVGLGVSSVGYNSNSVDNPITLDCGEYLINETRMSASGNKDLNVIFNGTSGLYSSASLLGFNFAIDTGWSQAQPISQQNALIDYIWRPVIAQNDTANAISVWTQADVVSGNTETTHIYASMLNNKKWGSPSELSVPDASLGEQAVVIDNNQAATAIWWQYTAEDGLTIASSRFSPLPNGTAPTITPPPDIDTEATGDFTAVDLGTATATDPIEGPLPVSVDMSGPFTVGTHFVTWSATNSKGVTVTGVQNVVVHDNTAPVLTIPSDISVNISDGSLLPTAIDIGSATATDIFQPVEISNDAPAKFDIGTTNVTWKATDIHGNVTTKAQKVTVNYSGSKYIRITYPVDGQTIKAGGTTVQGVIYGNADSGVMVNGKVAFVVDGKFYADNVSLNAGDNSLTASMTLRNGSTASSTVSVFSDSQSFATVDISRDYGIAPLSTTLSITYASDVPLGVISVDFDGDGVIDQRNNNTDYQFTHIYSEAGVYKPIVQVTDINGNVQTIQRVVVVTSAKQIDSLLLGIWDDFNKALLAGDKKTALMYIASGGRDKYSAVFDALMEYMPEIIGSYSSLTQYNVSVSTAEYSLTTRNEGKQFLYMITFIKDSNGVWHIEEM